MSSVHGTKSRIYSVKNIHYDVYIYINILKNVKTSPTEVHVKWLSFEEITAIHIFFLAPKMIPCRK